MPRSPAKSLTSTAASPPDTSLDPPRNAEEVRSWRSGPGRPANGPGGPTRDGRAAARRFQGPAGGLCALMTASE
jgi:hypothetical protein